MEFAKVYWMFDQEQHQVLVTKENDHAIGEYTIRERCEMFPYSQTSITYFGSPEARDRAFECYTLQQAHTFFDRVFPRKNIHQ